VIFDFADFWRVILSTGIIFFVFFLLFRRHILHVFDPLLFYIITQAFSIELGFLVIDKSTYLINLLICQACFLAGFFICAGKAPKKTQLATSTLFKNNTNFDVSIIKWYAIVTFAILLIVNIIQMKMTGIVLLSNNPSEAKVTSFTEGSGIIRRMNWGMLYVAGLFLLALILLKKQVRYAVLLLIILFIPALGGSKGALLYFILAISLFGCFSDIKSVPIFKKIQIGSFVLLIIAVILAGFIIYYSNSASSYNDILYSLVARFLFYGDSMIYYYNDATVQHFSHYTFLDYFQDDFNSVLGTLRLIPYNEQLGYRLINYYYNINSNVFGPSIPYYVKGNIYFGYYGAFVYSFIIGSVIGFIRGKFYKLIKNNRSSLLISLVIIHLNLFIYTLAQDSPVFLSVIFDTLLFSIPAILIVAYLHNAPKKVTNVA
jgi:oligosaccharide repeat unit polymerase